MIEIYYQDAYKIKRKQEFDSLDAAKLAFAGCLTLPDYYPVSKLLREGNELEFKGTIGDLYRYLQTLD